MISSSKGGETKVNMYQFLHSIPLQKRKRLDFFRGNEYVYVDLIDATMGENGEASGGQFTRQSNTGLKTGGWGVRRNSTLRAH